VPPSDADLELLAALDGRDDLLGELALACRQTTPSPAVRDRLMASVDALVRPGRLDRHAAALGALFDVTVDKARMFLGWIDDPSRWAPVGLRGVDGITIPAGPAWSGADCRILKVAAGGRFPTHRHVGAEAALILDGEAWEQVGGEVMGAGYLLERPAGTSHELLVGDEPCVFAVRSLGMTLG
jgi:anti-sigma factor ChrR (cupin superfamily)